MQSLDRVGHVWYVLFVEAISPSLLDLHTSDDIASNSTVFRDGHRPHYSESGICNVQPLLAGGVTTGQPETAIIVLMIAYANRPPYYHSVEKKKICTFGQSEVLRVNLPPPNLPLHPGTKTHDLHHQRSNKSLTPTLHNRPSRKEEELEEEHES